ncbi:Imm53 family immunity protein [Streptomyces olivaceus]|uniref:Imm53 family immunity protein n=1 Tax=Streptomyces olivaceus TaxID=47716 RepID=UPI0027E1364D|nr:Imm53 family immunity protein [Streptomyces olivaceus]
MCRHPTWISLVGRRFLWKFGQFSEEELVNSLRFLEAWYAAACDGDWEHSHGVRIETLDNPGWMLVIDLMGTPLQGRLCDREESSADGTWISVKSDGVEFVAAGDLHALESVINAFAEFSA